MRSAAKVTLGSLAFLGLIATFASPAQSTEILTLSSGADSVTYTGNGTTPLDYAGLLGGSDFAFALGEGTPLIGTSKNPLLGLLVSWTGAGTLNVSLEETGLYASVPLDVQTIVGGTALPGSSVTLASSSGSDPLSSFTFGPGSFSSAETAYGAVSGLYSLALNGTITNTSPLATSGFSAVVGVPEPGTFALIGAAMLGCLVFRGRRAATVA